MNRKAIALLMTVLFIVGLFSGCDNKDNTVNDTQIFDNSDKIIGDDYKEEEGELQSGLLSPGQKVQSYSGLIGCGYDVINSPYYKADHVKQRVLDVDKMVEDGLIYEDEYAFTNTDFVMEVGENISSYMSRLALNAGMSTSSLFGGSLKVDFGLDSQSKVDEKQSFAKGSVVITKTMQSTLMGNTTYKKMRDSYVTEEFKNGWLLNDEITPKDLLENFGTHIMLKVYLGGRLDMSYIYNNKECHDLLKIKTSVEASYGVVSGNASTENENEAKQFVSNSETKIRAEGGKVNINMTSFESAKENYDQWAESIQDNEYITLIKAGRLSSTTEMFPIWMLIDTSTNPNATAAEKKAEQKRIARYNAIFNEYTKQLDDAANSLAGYQKVVIPTYIKDIYFGQGTSRNAAISDLYSQCSEEFFLIDKDLNHKAGGRWIYLGYTLTTKPDEAIRGLTLRFEENPPNTFKMNLSTYNLIEKYDLNMKAGGYYIYLYYTREESAGKPITNLFVSVNDDFSGREGIGWIKVKDWARPEQYSDLNKSAGGSDIYLWFLK